MKIAMCYHSILYNWNHGNAHLLQGCGNRARKKIEKTSAAHRAKELMQYIYEAKKTVSQSAKAEEHA